MCPGQKKSLNLGSSENTQGIPGKRRWAPGGKCTPKFTHLGRVQSSNGKCKQDITHKISMAASAMKSLHKLWHQRQIELCTKICINNPASCLSSCMTLRHWPYRHKTVKNYRYFTCTVSGSYSISAGLTMCPTQQSRHWPLSRQW